MKNSDLSTPAAKPNTDPSPRLITPQRTRALVLLLLIVLIGWFDYLTGPDIGLSLFYLLPIVAAGWWHDRSTTVTAALVAGLMWFLADVAHHERAYLFITIWNSITRLGIYLAIGLLIEHTRRTQQHLTLLNDKLQEHLQRAEALARTDPLTGLLNSRAFFGVLQLEVERCREQGGSLCLAYLDLDNFKKVNDIYGHQAGDALIREAALALRGVVRSTDLPARLGGDEFAVLFLNIQPEAIKALTHRLIKQVVVVGQSFPKAGLSASVGIAYFSRAPKTPEDVVRHADAAMYKAKAQGKGCFVFWSMEDISDSAGFGG